MVGETAKITVEVFYRVCLNGTPVGEMMNVVPPGGYVKTASPFWKRGNLFTDQFEAESVAEEFRAHMQEVIALPDDHELKVRFPKLRLWKNVQLEH